MCNKKMQELLNKLYDGIQGTNVGAETRPLIQTLEPDIGDLLDSTTEPAVATSFLERKLQLKTTFVATHPVDERFIRETIDVLDKIGVQEVPPKKHLQTVPANAGPLM